MASQNRAIAKEMANSDKICYYSIAEHICLDQIFVE